MKYIFSACNSLEANLNNKSKQKEHFSTNSKEIENNQAPQINFLEKIVITTALFLSLISWLEPRSLPICLNFNLATAILVGSKNRYQIQLEQRARKNQSKNLTSMQQKLQFQENQIFQLDTKYENISVNFIRQQLDDRQNLQSIQSELIVLKNQSQQYINKLHLTAVINGIKQIKRKQKQLELGRINQVSKTVAEIQQQIQNLTHNLTLLSKQADQEIEGTHSNNDIAIFIDGSNLYYTLKKLHLEIDYGKFLTLLTGTAMSYQAYFYTGINYEDRAQLRFLSYLRRQGFQIISKKIVKRSDGSCKANLDVELAIDMLAKANTFNIAILVSGDGDFSYVVKKIKQQGKRVEVFSFPCDTSKALSQVANQHHNLHNLVAQIQRNC